MRNPRFRQGAQEARAALAEAGRLARGSFSQTLLLALSLGVAPCLLRGLFFVNSQGALLSVWEGWLHTVLSGARPPEGLVSLLAITMRQSGMDSLMATLFDLLASLLAVPLLLAALALLYNGFARRDTEHSAMEAVRLAWGNRRNLVVAALLCMLAEGVAQIVPSMVTGFLTLLAEILSWIPVLGAVAGVLAVVLSIVISLLTDFAVTVAFCYVWICASCEGASGMEAMARSWRLTRDAMGATVFALAGLLLLKWAVYAILGAVWLLAGRALALPLPALVCSFYVIHGFYMAALGAVASALYLRRPASGPSAGRYGNPAFGVIKSANID